MKAFAAALAWILILIAASQTSIRLKTCCLLSAFFYSFCVLSTEWFHSDYDKFYQFYMAVYLLWIAMLWIYGGTPIISIAILLAAWLALCFLPLVYFNHYYWYGRYELNFIALHLMFVASHLSESTAGLSSLNEGSRPQSPPATPLNPRISELSAPAFGYSVLSLVLGSILISA